MQKNKCKIKTSYSDYKIHETYYIGYNEHCVAIGSENNKCIEIPALLMILSQSFKNQVHYTKVLIF